VTRPRAVVAQIALSTSVSAHPGPAGCLDREPYRVNPLARTALTELVPPPAELVIAFITDAPEARRVLEERSARPTLSAPRDRLAAQGLTSVAGVKRSCAAIR
jgi:hypothetical protein